MADKNIENEIKKRRTFAIISHPDAGKTTLTEKFLLYGGAINTAGSVKGKANSKYAVSDWMEIEKERGISVTSSVLQFNYDGYCINILDTPGHQDFSEDTYRTLMAADSAVMVIDASKGVEAQTRKLFKVCVMRHIPIFTFINKMDLEARDSFELLDEIEAIVYSGTRINIDYFLNDVMDEDHIEDIYEYFKDSETDGLEDAIEELGGDYTEEEIRLVRIKFLSEMAN